MARCRDCKLYDLDAVKSASGAVLSSRNAACLWVSKEVWPASISDSWTRPVPHYMGPNDGNRCQRFIKRERP